MRWAKWLCAALPGMLLSACGDRQGSIDAALALADAIYPGQLELYDSHLQKGHYAVTLAVKGDPITRIRFDIDPDPTKCRVGSRCEERLRKAYAIGIAAGNRLKALNAAFPGCGVTMLGIDDQHVMPAFRAIIELDLDPADQQPELDRLAPCVAAFRAAMPPDTAPDHKRLSLYILRTGAKGATKPDLPVSFETRLDDARFDEPSYLTSIAPEANSPAAADLRLNAHFLSKKNLRETLAKAAGDALSADPRGGHVAQPAFLHDTRLDPRRLDVIRTYMLACSVHEPGKGPCKTDIAVRLRYDLTTGETSEPLILRDIRDARGNLTLPEIPGR